MTDIRCGEEGCGSNMILRQTTKFINKDGSPRKFYGCSRYPDCTGVHGAHQNSGKPHGIPADKETRQARVKAHEVFDAYVKKWFPNRREGYTFLQNIMKMTPSEAHISRFTKEQCEDLVKKLS